MSYWRENSREVDAAVQGQKGQWALEITSGEVRARALEGLAEFSRRHPDIEPLVICPANSVSSARRLGFCAQEWQSFLWDGPPGGPYRL